MNIDLRLGDCIEVLKTIPDNSIDSIVTDPPYGIGFMGKAWDTFQPDNVKKGVETNTESFKKNIETKQDNPNLKGRKNSPIGSSSTFAGTYDLSDKGKNDYQQWCYEWGKECLRVLKPGGHLLASNSPRMYHRMTIGLEDAGFEIRDQIMWVYGSGFPKSLNIGKAIDKRGGESIGWFGDWLKEWREENNIPQSKIAELFPSKTGGLTGCVSNWELGNNLPTNEQFNLICETFDLPFKSLEEAEREYIGTKTSGIGKAFTKDGWGSGHDEVEITKGNSEWEGWGTALKPAHEPIVLARKPLSEKSIAENVLKHGTGGINIDESRIPGIDPANAKRIGKSYKTDQSNLGNSYNLSNEKYRDNITVKVGGNLEGRFPANIIFDEEAGKLLDEQSGTSKTKPNKNYKHSNTETESNTFTGRGTYTPREDEGGASRFFYCPKTSKKDRNEGLDGFDDRPSQLNSGGIGRKISVEKRLEANGENAPTTKNNHPTVKPTDLMRYLINLITPKGGTTLDPFMGSGSTGKAAVRCGVNFIGIEKEEEYMKIAKARIEHERNKPVQQKLL